jgi:predicted DNA-binding transcriptional regulator AlpA
MESSEVLAAVAAGMVRIADMPPILGVTRQRCHQLAQRADFPQPVKTLGRDRLWRRADVERWADETGARPWLLGRQNGSASSYVDVADVSH